MGLLLSKRGLILRSFQKRGVFGWPELENPLRVKMALAHLECEGELFVVLNKRFWSYISETQNIEKNIAGFHIRSLIQIIRDEVENRQSCPLRADVIYTLNFSLPPLRPGKLTHWCRVFKHSCLDHLPSFKDPPWQFCCMWIHRALQPENNMILYTTGRCYEPRNAVIKFSNVSRTTDTEQKWWLYRLKLIIETPLPPYDTR